MLAPLPQMIADRTGVPIAGVIPMIPDLRIQDEDAAVLDSAGAGRAQSGAMRAAVIRFPRVSNFDDFAPLERCGVRVDFVTTPEKLAGAHLVILPGTKSTIADLRWMKSRGLDRAVRSAADNGAAVLGICGGFQMLGTRLEDPYGVDIVAGGVEDGLGLIDSSTIFAPQKRTRRVNFTLHTGPRAATGQDPGVRRGIRDSHRGHHCEPHATVRGRCPRLPVRNGRRCRQQRLGSRNLHPRTVRLAGHSGEDHWQRSETARPSDAERSSLLDGIRIRPAGRRGESEPRHGPHLFLGRQRWRRRMKPDITLVIGGVRSGKSRFAADLASRRAGGGPVLFVATARRGTGAGMEARIENHRASRPDHWQTVEAPLDLAEALRQPSNTNAALVDCITIWISNIMFECGDSNAPEFEDRARDALNRKVDALMGALAATKVPVVLVANEVGAGVAPPTRLGIVFADLQGEVNQKVAARANTVWQTVAGIPVRIK